MINNNNALPNELIPYENKIVNLFLETSTFSVSLRGKLIQAKAPDGSQWYTLKCTDSLLFLELDWNKIKVKEISETGWEGHPSIFLDTKND